jgi:hypothetical protein
MSGDIRGMPLRALVGSKSKDSMRTTEFNLHQKWELNGLVAKNIQKNV